MKTVKRNRYYCDFCKKSGGYAGHMRKHEERCTLNPNRKCGVCGMIEETQEPIAVLLDCLPEFDSLKIPCGYGSNDINDGYSIADSFKTEALKFTKALRDKANNCPACMMAAFRQKGIPIPEIKELGLYDFTKEMQSIWSDINSYNDDGHY